MTYDLVRAHAVLEEGYGFDNANISPIAVGLINQTYRVELADRTLVLQRVNPIFTPLVHQDIEAVTGHLAQKGLPTPRLVTTRNGALCYESDGEVWRVLTHISGVTHDQLSSKEQARSAGKLLARFHRAVQDLDYTFQNRRLGVHDTPVHLRTLERALKEHTDHPRYGVVAPLGEQILTLARDLPALKAVPDRVVHGDPKISNVIFGETGEATCLIDLDTMARMPVFLELGDAFRSWCNPGGEDQTETLFSAALFRQAVSGYAESMQGTLLSDEWQCILPATQTIIVELAARFGADALNESYFGWDEKRFETRGEHNELRARGQVALVHSLMSQRQDLEAAVREAFVV